MDHGKDMIFNIPCYSVYERGQVWEQRINSTKSFLTSIHSTVVDMRNQVQCEQMCQSEKSAWLLETRESQWYPASELLHRVRV